MSHAKPCVFEQKTVDSATIDPNGFSRSFTRYHFLSAQALSAHDGLQTYLWNDDVDVALKYNGKNGQ